MNDILDDSYESDLTDEEHERLILISEHAIAKPLPMTPEQQVRSIKTETTAYGATDIDAMNARVIVLDTLYHLAGRSNPDHTYTGLYTGLWAPMPDENT